MFVESVKSAMHRNRGMIAVKVVATDGTLRKLFLPRMPGSHTDLFALLSLRQSVQMGRFVKRHGAVARFGK